MKAGPPNSSSSTAAGGVAATGASVDDLRNASAISSGFGSTVSETAVLIRPQQHGDQGSQLLEKAYARVSWHLMPLFLVVMVLNHVDRTNLAYASITMNADLGIGPAAYGLGSALFFIPFCFFQIPSNLVVARVGVRRWLAVLLLGWGTVASCMSLIHAPSSFFALRLLLGMFEAGAVPAMWFHLSTFYPVDRITKPFTMLTVGTLVAQAVSGPVAAGFLAMNGLGGLHGWRWLFLLEGLPTVCMSAVVWCCLPDSISTARWLSESEKKALEADLVLSSTKNLLHESGHNPPGMLQPPQHRSHQQHLEDHGVLKLLGTALSNPWLLALCFLGILLASASNTYVFFLPMIIQALLHGSHKPSPVPSPGGKTVQLLPVILTCIPYTLAAISCWLVAHSSQKRRELYIHTALPAFIGGVFFVLFPFVAQASIGAGFACLVLVAVSGACAIGPKTAIVHQVTQGPSQVVGMPLYNSIIVLGGFAGPFVTGIIVQRTGNFTRISVLFGMFLLIFGTFLVVMKYVLRSRDRKAAFMAAAARVGSDPPGSAVPAPGCAAGTGAGGQVAGLDGKVPPGAAADAAAVAGAGTVVVQSDRDDGFARPRVPPYSALDRV